MQEIPGADIRIFDSLTAATPISALALDVLKKADEGAGMDELEAFINGAIARTETCFSGKYAGIFAEGRAHRCCWRAARKPFGHSPGNNFG